MFIEVIYQIGIKYKSIKAKSSKLLTKFQVKMKVKVKVKVEVEVEMEVEVEVEVEVPTCESPGRHAGSAARGPAGASPPACPAGRTAAAAARSFPWAGWVRGLGADMGLGPRLVT